MRILFLSQFELVIVAQKNYLYFFMDIINWLIENAIQGIVTIICTSGMSYVHVILSIPCICMKKNDDRLGYIQIYIVFRS